MKRLISILCSLGIVLLIYQLIVTFFMFRHTSKYSVGDSDLTYMITEKFKKKGKHHMYSFLIEDPNKNNFVFSYDIDFNKSSKVIEKIEKYQENGTYCLAPVLKGNRVDFIECIKNQELISYSYMKQIEPDSIANFMNQLKMKNYTLNENMEKEYIDKEEKDNMFVFKDMPEDISIAMWNYKGVSVLNHEGIKREDFLDNDSYFNEDFSILAGYYYVTLNKNNSNNNAFYIVNVRDGGKALIESDYEISSNLYFNGVYKGNAYFTDISNKRQYLVNPKKEVIEEVDTNSQGKYYDGEKLSDVNMAVLTSEKKYFVDQKIPQDISEKYAGISFKESYGNYYYNSDGSVYQVVGEFPDYKIKLFQFSELKEMKVVNNHVYGIVGDSLYLYHNQLGLKKIAGNRELNYNYKNIYDVYEG